MEYFVEVFGDSFVGKDCKRLFATSLQDLFKDSEFKDWLGKFDCGYPCVTISESSDGYAKNSWSVNSCDDSTDDIMNIDNYQ